MSPRRASLSVALFALGLMSACTLRPYYRDLVRPAGQSTEAVAGQVLQMRIVDPSTGQPISGAKVSAGTGRDRLSTTSDAEGRLSVPVSKALLEENPLVEVVLPKGVKRYELEIFQPKETPAAEPPPAQPSETPAETDSPGSSTPETPAPSTPPSTPGTGA